MTTINNLFNNKNIRQIESAGTFTTFEHQNDLSVNPFYAETSYFMKEMNIKRRQVLCKLEGNSVKVQAGAMQWMSGNIEMQSGVKGVGGFLGNLVKSKVTGESVAKPIYSGNGYVMLEPTFNYLLIEDVASWGSGIVLSDGMFLACDNSLTEKIVARSNVSSALLGGEGLFNLSLSGNGHAVLESPVPREELIEFNLDNDVVKIDGNMAIAWSSSLEFTVEKSGKSLLGSALSGEGLVNVYRGTGKILMAPTVAGTTMDSSKGPKSEAKTTSGGLIDSVKNSIKL